MRENARPIRKILALAALASALVNTACVTTESPPPVAAGPVAAAEPPPSAYVSMLRSQGVETAIPPHGKFILVNIPSFELIALQDGVPVLRSRVVVGKPAAATPELLSSMFAVQFNPAWTPTPLMMFDLDNDEFIYLHDTNEKGLFKREQRALSHGCIRVEQARALAAWSLGVSEQEIDAMVARGTTYSVPVPEIIPVSLVYYTRFPDEGGQVASYSNIYADRLAQK
jgi:murein L,D-transpeptidase YcbB/YkuD